MLSLMPGRLVVVGPTQTVVTRNPKVGVHTRLTDEVEPWKVQRTLQMVREMGSPWVVEYFPWAYYEPAPGRYEWSHADLVVEHAVAQGLTVIARIDMVPEWARPSETTDRYLAPENYADYARFIEVFVTHFRGRVRYVVIWNEPNLAFEWGYRPPDPAAYAELLKQAYQAAKRADPSIRVLAAGLAPTIAPPGDPFGYNDLLYLDELLRAGAGAYMDGLAAHAYGMTFPHDDPPAPDMVNFRRVELLHEVMLRHGLADKPVYITEGGWNDNPRWTRAVRPYQRIAYTIGAYEQARAWGWCEAVCLWAFRFPWLQNTYADGYSFVSPAFIPKPIYEEVSRYSAGKPFEYLEELP
ncbi:MAG: hypothetical protein GXY52_02815 [Chloroflexi bacterium]|nr:hypothetical protein [Chloroflexota bacterium]